MNQNPYYPTELQQAVALRTYEAQVEEILELINSLMLTKQLPYSYGKLLADQIKNLGDKKDDMKIRVTIPAGKVQTTTNVHNQLVGVPNLGEAEHYIMTEDEFVEWQKVWLTDGAMGQMVIIERLARA